uniref:Synaptotagmin like 1 n=1 Tax=Monodon monoceros TaxID=40151 RepID=A0A8C6F3S8_MONMO
MPQRGHPSQKGLWSLPGLLMAHEPQPEADGLLDLSFLTEEEQEAIAKVLKRDARLRQLEEGRVSKLRTSLADPGQLKILTGDWFQEARFQRHHHAHLGSDLVRASIRRKKGSRGDQAQGSNGEAQAAGKETEEALEPRLPVDEAPQERFSEAEASDHEEEPQAQEAPGPGGVQAFAAEEADPELEPPSRGEEPQPPPAQTQEASEILENGEEAPGPDLSLDRVLSSSSSTPSLNSSTLSSSQMSLSGEAEAGAVQVRGSLYFALRYEPGAAQLRVHVIQCQGLAAARRRRSDPYVKSKLLPDKQSKRKTSVKKRNLNPVFNETLWVPPSPDDLPSRGLLSLSLKYVPAGSEGAGLPSSGELHFWVKEAQDLVPLRPGSLDTYIQCLVLPDDSQGSRQRTRVVRHSLSPTFNHTMVYDGFGPADLRQACAELSLWDHGPLASRQLGGTRLSLGTGSSYGLQVPWMDSTPEERQLWQTLLERPCEWVHGLLPLRTNLAPRTLPYK